VQKGSLPGRRNVAPLRMSRAVFGFYFAIAVISAAIADPLVECASNAGWFGPGSFTDRSNLDVVPALLAGIALLALFMLRKARAVLTECEFPRGSTALLPSIFILQMLTLYVMETTEQLLTSGHLLGPTIWLGAPPPISLAAHATVCVAVTYAIVRSRRALAATTLRVVRLIAAIATFAPKPTSALAVRRFNNGCFKPFSPVLCTVGERAPPRMSG
jgi:hypothetical protein